MPAVYTEACLTIEACAAGFRPHGSLHFGFAARRSAVCVEARALNRVNGLRPDARKSLAHCRSSTTAPFVARSKFPSEVLAASFRRAGLNTKMSIDAGDYVCNYLFFHALTALDGAAGFVHIPPLLQTRRRQTHPIDRRPSIGAVTRGAVAAIKVVARTLRGGLMLRVFEPALIPPRRTPTSP